MPADITVAHNTNTNRFETDLDGYPAVVEYMLARPNTIVFTHTEVAPEIEGRGVAAQIARAGLEYAREQGLEVMPLCPFVATYIRRHPEYREILKAGFNV